MSFHIQVTSRDIAILQFINQFGFCEINHIQRQFSLTVSRSYQVMKRLTQADLIQHNRLFYGRSGFFQVSRKGAEYTDLPSIEKISISNYFHHLTVIDVYLVLQQLYSGSYWISERQLLHDKYVNGLPKKGHVADGILVLLPTNKKIAVEIELTFKGNQRTIQILKGYAAQFAIKEVWYFCFENVLERLCFLAKDMSFVKLHNLKEFCRY